MDYYVSENIAYLIFSVNNEKYAIEVSKVIEVLRNPEIFPVPKTQSYIDGIINFRGDVIIVVNTKKKINIQLSDESVAKKIVVVLDLEFNDRPIKVCALVDKVLNVLNISEKDIKPVPEFGNYFNPEFLKGAFQVKEEYVMIMDIEKIFSSNDVEIINDIANKNRNKKRG